ncbi:MAG: helix-turn-helix domain-containing protein [Steroidobacteraceae bacterium]
MCGLGRVCTLGRLADTAGRVGLRVSPLRVSRGDVLYRSGDLVKAIYMIRSGCVKELDGSSSGHGSVINFALPGESLVLHALNCTPSNTTGLAVESSFICSVPWDGFNRLCAESPRVAAQYIQLLARAGAAARDLSSMIRDKDAYQRVSGFLLNVSRRLQVRGVRGREFRLHMNREDIANYLGLRSETVSRCFTNLSRRRLIKVHAKRIQILRAAELRKIFTGAESFTHKTRTALT